ncbi:EamA family transporter [Vibrio cholerae]
MLAVSKLELSSAYPLTSASFVLVFIASAILFGEPISLQKLIGISLIVVGIIIIGRAM